MQATATWRKGHELLLEDGRAHSVVVDLPPEEGGASAGTTPLELSVLALAGSLASTFVTVAKKRHLIFSSLSLVLEGDPPASPGDRRGFHGTLRLRSRADRADVEGAFETAVQISPLARMFREARIPVNVVVVIAAGARNPEVRSG